MGILHPSIPEVTWLDNVCLLILILAAFNWGLYGLFDINLVTHFVENPYIHAITYLVIVFAGVKALTFWHKCLACSKV